MGTYMGNVGHLMQHWTLCEILSIAQVNNVPGLNYIDAHAMAPWAIHRRRQDAEFDHVRDGLTGQNSTYEQAWHALNQARVGQPQGYPSSAAFVRQIWNCHTPYSMLLCEIDNATANAIDAWLIPAQDTLFKGDWRQRFEQHLPNPAVMGFGDDALTLISFDPDLYSTALNGNDLRALYRRDLDLTLASLGSVNGPTIIQLSTYTANGSNPQGKVISSVNAVLYGAGFALAAVVRVHGHMMSMVYARHNVEWAAQLAGLPDDFTHWLGEVRRRMRQQV